MQHTSIHLQGGYPPVTSGLLPGLDEEREADEIDGGGDGERPDVSQHQTHQSWETEDQLEQRGNQDGSLDLSITRKDQHRLKIIFVILFRHSLPICTTR